MLREVRFLDLEKTMGAVFYQSADDYPGGDGFSIRSTDNLRELEVEDSDRIEAMLVELEASGELQ